MCISALLHEDEVGMSSIIVPECSRDAWESFKQPGLTGTFVSNAGTAAALGAGAAIAGGNVADKSIAAAASGPGGAAAATDATAAAGPFGFAGAAGAADAGGIFSGPVNTAGAAAAFGMAYYPSHSALQSCTFVLLL